MKQKDIDFYYLLKDSEPTTFKCELILPNLPLTFFEKIKERLFCLWFILMGQKVIIQKRQTKLIFLGKKGKEIMVRVFGKFIIGE